MAETSKIRVLIVDDEPLARKKIQNLLKNHSDIEVVGECSNGIEAVDSVKSLRPDLVFLDIQIPHLNGLKVSEALSGPDSPLIIFVTAYDQHAVRAFDLQALDFVLKPYDRERFEKALTRAKNQIREKRNNDLGPQILAMLNELRERPKYLDRIAMKDGSRVFFIKREDIDWISAEGNYVRLHLSKESYLYRENLTNLITQLDPAKFRRIHRSTVINLDRIQELRSGSYGDYTITLISGVELTVGRSFRDELRELLGKSS